MNLRSFISLSKIALAALFMQASLASGAELKLFSGTGMRPALEELAPQFERSMGHKVAIQYESAIGLKRKIDAGEVFDVALLTPRVMDELVKAGKVAGSTLTAIGRSGMGMAARAGAPKPAIDSAESFKRALLGAKSIAYFPEGATGTHIARIAERFGIAQEMKSRLKPAQTAEQAVRAVANGEAELAFSGMPTILGLRGVQLVGPLPPELQDYVVYVAALSSATNNAPGGKAFINSLTDDRAVAVLKAKGFEPAAPR